MQTGRPRTEHGTSVLGERERLLGRQEEHVPLGVVAHITSRRLVGEPLAHVPRVGLRAAGERFRGDGLAVAHRSIQPEPVADHHQRRAHCGAEVTDEPVHELLELVLVDCGCGHDPVLSRRSSAALSGASRG